jgi:hypothetical protein
MAPWSTVVALGATLAAYASTAHAQKRPVPDYDGRPDRTTAGEVALWVPRVILFPVYLVSDYVVRRPLGWALTTVEREWVGESHSSEYEVETGLGVGVLPTFRLETSFRPRVGLRLGLERLFVPRHALRAHLGFWGVRALSVGLLDRVTAGKLTLDTRLGWERRPDDAFWGLGPESRDGDRGRF